MSNFTTDIFIYFMLLAMLEPISGYWCGLTIPGLLAELVNQPVVNNANSAYVTTCCFKYILQHQQQMHI